MKKISRLLLCGALTLTLLTAACAGQEGTPTVVVPTFPGSETASPPPVETEITETTETVTSSPEATLDTTATVDLSATVPAATDATQPAAMDTTQTPGVPTTGAEVGSILLECQFCIDGMAQALLVIPDTATFETVADT